jgi:acyl-CoA thioester hydrolase
MTPFQVRMSVRSYELDQQRHVNGAVYVQYADHARYECARAAGVSIDALLAGGIGPVNLETTIRFLSELRDGDEVDVTCTFVWGDGKTHRVEQVIRRLDGTVAAEIRSVGGLLDLTTRRLVPDPAAVWHSHATHPEVLNLPPTPRESTPSGR